jgi:hypothetical protein
MQLQDLRRKTFSYRRSKKRLINILNLLGLALSEED